MSEVDRPKAGQDIAGAALGALVGLAMGDPAVGAVTGAAATRPLADLVGAAWQELHGRREANAVGVVLQAAGHVRATPAEFLTASLEDADMSRLLQAALQAAAASLDEDKVTGLARCLANGFYDAARIDEELLTVRALADLDPVHVRALAFLAPDHGQGRQFVPLARIHSFLRGESSVTAWDATDLADPVVAVLQRHGLVRTDDGKIISPTRTAESLGGVGADLRPPPRPQAAITAFGELCLRHLRQHDAGDGPGSPSAEG